ncbi:ribonuclease P [Methanoculleus taiwanensis]|uniref:Ribonuclease P protein component 1 n=1 Tax=Methanoculleus taiwanensis TaxID=1550565 RepID=A0A498H045_9EURY|nr:ribonuclease P protein subunit [Methanoculleus taiwanensis]RXE55757.1 ribonuclease P [Methanoculleus taiwanensis]
MISPQNVLRHELIGMNVLVVGASNKSLVGLSGRIIDETRNTLVIATERGEKRIQKRYSILQIRLPGGDLVEIDASTLVSQPDKRITMRMKL